MTHPKPIEICARAIGRVETEMGDEYLDEMIHAPWQKSWEVPIKPRWEQWEDAARACITALAANISEEMVEAGHKVHLETAAHPLANILKLYPAIFTAMLSAIEKGEGE